MTPITGTNSLDWLWATVRAPNGSGVSYPEFFAALAISLALSLSIGFVYQRTYRGRRYQQDFVHTLVIMGVVVSVVMMVVGDNMARAFGIFAAFSMIRFRRNLPEARDLGFLFFALVVGLTAGSREYAFAGLTTVLVCAAIVVMSRLDLFGALQASFNLRVRVPMDLDHQQAFADLFDRMLESATLTSTETVAAESALELRFEVRLKEGVTPADLVAELYTRNEGLKISLNCAKNR